MGEQCCRPEKVSLSGQAVASGAAPRATTFRAHPEPVLATLGLAPRQTNYKGKQMWRGAIYVLATAFFASTASASGYYTSVQAKSGHAVFDQHCAICHGEHLQGKIGPALSGKQFLSVSQYQKLTAGYLFWFMSRHMPQNAPGSLTKTQYVDLLAYILKVNGYPAGSHKLPANTKKLQKIKIEPQGGNT
jgi:mono/diheme cytochrome c family protein